MKRILLVEDEHILAESILDALELEEFSTAYVSSLAEARKHVEGNAPDLVLLDLTLPDGSGLEFLDYLAAHPTNPTIIVLTADASVNTAVRAIRSGAFDYLAKPFDLDVLLHRINNAITHQEGLAAKALQLRVNELERYANKFVPPASPKARELYELINRVAVVNNMIVLVAGETGTGKEHICRLLHDRSPRSKEPFIAINCANLDKNLLQSELFGHERGAFTGATERRKGLFECVGHGTLLLDEVSEMPLDVQASLLRVLETGRFRRLGGMVELETSARIIAATNKDLEQMVKEHKFRPDLFFRLNQLYLNVPPLRERREDIRPLAEQFCLSAARDINAQVTLTDQALEALLNYSWPGNVRELKNLIFRTVIIKRGGAITAEDLRLESTLGQRPPAAPPAPAIAAIDANQPFLTLAEMEAAHIRQALKVCAGNRTQAAKLLGIARSSLLRKLDEMERPQSDSTSQLPSQ